MDIKYTIIVPTCNGSLVNKCLEYISKLNKPKFDYEVLVLHNATMDDIESIVTLYCDKIPNLRYIYELEDGLMASRHRGAKEAKGSILCYLDDDSFVDENYLLGIEDTFADQSVVCACGPNIPLYESEQPKWLKYFWGLTPWGDVMGELSLMNLYNKIMDVPTWFAFGCNMVIKRDVFFEVGGTNPDCMPPNKLLYTGDGETALSVRLHKKGYFARYNPQIKIHHLVPTSRMTEKYFIKRATYQGICDSFTDIRVENNICSKFDFKPSSSIKIPKRFYIRRKIRKLINKLRKAFPSFKTKAYRDYERIKLAYANAYEKSYHNHHNAVKKDINLLNWALKENYL